MLARHKGELPFATYLLPFVTGIAVALNFNLQHYQTWFTAGASTLFALFLVSNFGFAHFKIYQRAWVGGALMHLLLLCAGLMCTVQFNTSAKPAYFERHQATQLIITIDNQPQFKNGYLRFIAEVNETVNNHSRKQASGKILITLPVDTNTLKRYAYGDVLLITNKAAPVDPPFNPAEFNYKQYLSHQNVYSQAFLNPGEVALLAHNNGHPTIAYALKLRNQLVKRFKQNMHSAEAVAVASTLILGYKADLSEDVMAAYSHTGTIHILSVSGGHVIILFTLLGWVLGFMDSWRYGRFVKAGIIVLFVGYYALLTGLSPAACRAAVMVAMLTIGKAFYRQAHALNILATSAFIQLVFNPFLLADVGFQLSYLAVAGLVIFQPIIYSRIDIENRWLDWLWKFFSASVAAQAITFPLAAYYFHQFPAYFLISNLFILPLAEVIMYLGLGLLVIAQAGTSMLARLTGKALEFFILLMDNGLRNIEHWPYAYIDRIWITRLECLLLVTAVVMLFAWVNYRKGKLLIITMVLLLCFSAMFNLQLINKERHNGLTFLNLRKHTGIVFKQGLNAVLVTDLDDTAKAYRYSIKLGLDSNGISKVLKCRPHNNVATPWLVKQGNLMRSKVGDVLMIDSMLPRPRQSVPASFLLIAEGNAKNALPLIESNNYKTVIIGAGITPKNTIALRNYASVSAKKIFFLRRNFSLILKSD